MPMTLGIRREEKAWERRTPLVPTDVKQLTAQGIKVVIQPSNATNAVYTRIFSDGDFRAAGASVQEDLSECEVQIGVKEFPVTSLIADKIFMYFSHTIKGQPYNMPMLKHILANGCSLIDYEPVTDATGRRLIFFGRHAGMAGMVDSLWALGRRLEADGYQTPLAQIKQMYEYADFKSAMRQISKISKKFIQQGIPDALKPFVIGIAGYGNVSKGAQAVFDHLPSTQISPEELLKLDDKTSNTIYRVIFEERHTVKPKDTEHHFVLHHYFAHPESYESQFYQYVPHLTMLINAIFWTEKNPRLLNRQELRNYYQTYRPDGPGLRVIGDISCDIDGAIQATQKSTKPDHPVFVYLPETGELCDGYVGHGPVIMAVDNLPCELSKEASESFSEALAKFVPALISANYGVPYLQLNLPPELKKALIVYKGELTPPYQYLAQFIK